MIQAPYHADRYENRAGGERIVQKMPPLNLVVEAQIALVLVGLVFQVAAFVAMRKDWSCDAACTPETPRSREEKPARKPAAPAPLAPQRSERDYYQMEDVPRDVPPAELLRTAKVYYVQSFKSPRA